MRQGIEKALQESGVKELNSIQKEMLQKYTSRKNILLQAPTGSGKTYAFLIPLLDRIEPDAEDTKGLIIAPTRELALQTAEEAEKLSVYTGHHIVTVIGGMNEHHQENALKHRPSVLIGTPGRLKDLLDQNKINLHETGTVILDEADQILSTGQKEDVLSILRTIPSFQCILVSATWKDELKTFLNDDYIKVSEGTVNTLNANIHVYYDICADKQKELLQILHHEKIRQSIIFVRYKYEADDIASLLQKNNILSSPFSSAFDERKRRHVLHAFKEGNIRILCATDAAARGLDITDVSHIIHYDLPQDEASFIHRSGRTAHQNNTGNVIVLLTEDEAVHISLPGSPYILPETSGSDLSVPFIKEERKTPSASTLWINAGRRDKIRPKDIIGALCTVTSFDNLGALEIQDTSSTIVIKDASRLSDLRHLSIKGKPRKYKLF